ncbi:LOW QUALITY PROTEIN: uncharacterized protein [Diadema setosum]|uniref:LOW QUALITY PROTEIN: uncharacterized protein n=1 Tax=Diadema setosum TaxID=31175 RepID=UPI003B3ABE27
MCDQISETDISCSLSDFNNAFSLEVLSIPQSIPICSKHRSHLRNIKTKIQCSFCKSYFKHGRKYLCSSLSEECTTRLQTVNDEFVLQEDSVLCSSCQRFAIRNTSAPKSFKELEEEFSQNIDLDVCESDDEAEIMTKVLNLTFRDITKICSTSKSFLLSSAYDCFLSNLKMTVKDPALQLELTKSKAFLLTRIHDKFGIVLKMHKSARKKGLFFYLSDLSVDDIVEAWHSNSFEVRQLKIKLNKASGSDGIETHYSSFESHESSAEMNAHFTHVLSECNTNLRSQEKKIREHYLQDPTSVIKVQLNEIHNLFHPLVWNAISLLTATKEEYKYFQNTSVLVEKEFVNFPSDTSRAGAKRKCKRIILTCLLQSILNEENSYPVHIATGTLIKRLSRSSKLLKLCNNLGLACSEDTLARFWQQQFDRRQKLGITSTLTPNSLTVISIDNVDVLSPYAAVRADVPRSWHGTSVMAQQPKPVTEKLDSLEILEDPMDLLVQDESDTNVHDVSSSSSMLDKSDTFTSGTKKPTARKKIRLDESALPSARVTDFEIPSMKTFVRSQLSIDDFSCTTSDNKVLKDFFIEMFIYVGERFSLVNSNLPVQFPGFKCKLALQVNREVEKSKFAYLFVLDEKADSSNTLKNCLGILCEAFQIGRSINHLIVAGDGATVKLLLNLKKEYGQSLDWMLPFLGDWHTLKNYQEVIMKIFWHAGLKEVAKLAHKKMTLQSLASCSSFKKTHRFIMQSYEAVFMCLIKSFLDNRQGKEVAITNDHFMQELTKVVSHIKFDEGKHTGLQEFKEAELNLLSQITPLINEFDTFCDDMSQKCETFKFWYQFLREDCFAYISLHIAMRKGDWNLRLVALKKMAPVFQAFDRHNYSSLIPAHLKMIGGMPDYIRKHFEQGSFVSSISGSNYSYVGFDEGHEMLINKDTKTALSHSMPKDMNKVAGILQQQAQLIKNLEEQFGIENENKYQRDLDISVIRSEFDNVRAYYSKLQGISMFQVAESRTLFQLFTQTPATTIQQKCLLNYRQMGEDAHIAFCHTFMLGETSVKKPVTRKFNLKTFAKEKTLKGFHQKVSRGLVEMKRLKKRKYTNV